MELKLEEVHQEHSRQNKDRVSPPKFLDSDDCKTNRPPHYRVLFLR